MVFTFHIPAFHFYSLFICLKNLCKCHNNFLGYFITIIGFLGWFIVVIGKVQIYRKCSLP